MGDRPTRVKARSPVAWIAGRRETKFLKPIDKVTLGVMSKSAGRNESKRIGGLESAKVWKPNLQLWGEGSIGKRKLADLRLSYSSGVIATACWQGHIEQLEKPYLSREEILGEDKLYNQ